MERTNPLVAGLIDGLEPEQRRAATPCDGWTVDDLLAHMCAGAHAVADGLEGRPVPAGIPGHRTAEVGAQLAGGPAAGWAAAAARLVEAATPGALEATHQMPFGPTPGHIALAVITADHITHAWDLAQATDQSPAIDDELAAFALAAWRPALPADGRTGDGFKAAVPVAQDATALDRLVAYTGRRPTG